MPGKLWPTLFGGKKEIRYIWRSSWFEPKPIITARGLLLIIILLAVIVSVFIFIAGTEFFKPEQTAKNVIYELQNQSNATQGLQLEMIPAESRELNPQELINQPESKEDAVNLSLLAEQEIEKKIEEKKKKIHQLLNSRQILGFGWQYNKLYQDWRFHPGIDFAADTLREIPAIMDGQVADVITDHNLGLMVIVQNGEYQTYYGALHSTILKKKDLITAGDIIGITGTGERQINQENPHLHLGIKSLESDKYINPLEFLEK